MPFPPSLFLIGAQKAGTTFLATLLGQHPDVCLADPKEPHFFTQNWDKGESWYRERFSSGDSKYLLDASPSYSAAPLGDREYNEARLRMSHVPQRVAAMSPGAKFIYILRDPVKRAHSSYWHAVRGDYEERTFMQVITDDTPYLDMGCYFRQLERYLQYFDRDKFLLMFFEDFVKDPQGSANQVLQWLGLPPLAEFELSKGKNQTYVYGPFMRWLISLSPDGRGFFDFAKNLRTVIPQPLLQMVRRALTRPAPELSREEIQVLLHYFEPQNRLLEEKLGLQLPMQWMRLDDASPTTQ